MAPRIFVAESFAADATVALPAAAVRHVHALRLQPGDALVLFNGSDGAEWPGAIVEIGRNRVVVRVGTPVAVARELAFEVTLAIGMPANDRMDALVEKAGELGAAAIQPLVCERSVLRLSGERAEARRRHWQAVAVVGERAMRARARRRGAADRADVRVAALECRQRRRRDAVVLSFDRVGDANRSARSPLARRATIAGTCGSSS